VILGSGGYYSFPISDQYLEGKNVYHGYTVGGAYAFNDICSVSLAARYINAEKEGNGFVTLSGLLPDATFGVDYEQDDGGLGFILGLNFAPAEEWNIGLRYESKTGLDLDYTVNRDDVDILTPEPGGILPPTGFTESRDLPAILGLGVAYTVSPKVRIEADLTYYLNDDADWSDPKFAGVDNGYDLGIALEYTFSPELKGSVGYLLTQTGLDPDGMLLEYPELDAHTISAGVAYEFNSSWTSSVGLAKIFYGDETTSSGIMLEKDVMLLGVGVQYRF